MPPNGQLRLHRGWLTESEASALQQALREQLDWQQREIVLFGKRVMQPRLIAWAGDVGYRYSGQSLPPRASTQALQALEASVAAAANCSFNHVLVNRYRNGDDSMGWHSDDEPELGENPTLASLSLGAPRRFVVRAKKRSSERSLAIELRHGDLLIMSGDLQHHYRHALPKQASVKQERINLTYRRIRP